MEQSVKNNIIGIIKRFFAGDPAALLNKSENDLIDISVTFITQVMLGIFRRKRMRPYIMQLLDIPPIAERVAEWRCSKIDDQYDYLFESNILHLACEVYDKAFILHVIEKCGKELMSIPNYDNILPVTMLLYNHHYKDVFDVLKYFQDNDADVTQLKLDLYDRISNEKTQSKKTIREIIRFFCESQLLTPKDVTRVEKQFKQLCGINEWMYSKKNNKFPRLNEEIIYFYAMAVKSQPPTREEGLYRYLCDNHIFRFIMGSQAELTDALIRNKLTDQEIEEIIENTFSSLEYSPRPHTSMKFLETYMPLLPNNEAIMEVLSYSDTSQMYLWICKLKMHTYNLPTEYLQVLKPHVEAWVYGPISSKHEQIDFAFDIQKLPSDLIAQVVGFVPYKSVRAFALTCKKFREFVDKNLLIWQSLTQKYFPLDDNNNAREKTSFLTKFKNKFVSRSNQPLPVRAARGFKSLEVTRNNLVWSSPDNFGLFDMETYSIMQKNHSLGYDCFVRMFNDILFVKTTNKVETYAKHDLSKIGSFDAPCTEQYFAVNDQYLFSDDFVYDIQQGEVIANFRVNELRQCLIRNNICYGFSSSCLCVIDPRTNPALVVAKDLEFDSRELPALNVYDNTIYTAHDYVEIFDIRMMNQSRKSQGRLGRNKIIDLVSMNVWSDKVVWDLTDLEWSYVEASADPGTRLTVCNGKHVIHSEGYSLNARPLSGTHYFPYGDFRE